MILRLLSEEMQKTSKGILLLGPRQVGKSTLINSLKPDLSINLADELEFMTHTSKLDELARMIDITSARTIFVDEVQRLPRLLNTIQALIDKNRNLKFYLTGSSARKLKRGGANLLPGRILNYKIGPLVASEMNYQFETRKVLELGSLPEIYLEKNISQAQKILLSYSANYLKEEIKAEALVRNLESFSRFLNEVVLSIGQFVDYTKLAKRAKISRHAIPRYFEILEDTLVGHRMMPFKDLVESEDLIRHSKFFLFDNGVTNGLLGNFVASQDRIGALAEQLIHSQLLHSAWARDEEIELSSFRTRKGVEVDFIIKWRKKVYAIEVKTADHLSSDDCEGLIYFAKKFPKHGGLFIFHLGLKEQRLGPVWALPWQKGLRELGL
jgi:predicted AAA+ superfamily ATPase